MVESAGRAEASITRLASATASGAHASSSSTSCVTASSSSPGRRDARREADPLGLLRADQLAGHHELLRPPEPDDLGQPRGPADVGDQPDPRLGHADDRVRGEHAEVARERQLERAADARAVDRADDRLGHLLGQVPRLEAVAPERAQVLGRRAQRAERPEVHARREERPRAAHDHHADGRVLGGGPQRGARGQHELVVERIALLRPVEDEVADGAVIF